LSSLWSSYQSLTKKQALVKHQALAKNSFAGKSFDVLDRGADTVNPVRITLESIDNEDVSPDGKYLKSSLSNHDRTRIQRKINETMENDQLYLRSGLTLSMLGDQIGEKIHYVSQVINQDFSMSFFDLINKYRIDEAKRIFQEGKKRSIADVAEIVGFNSKSTFNLAFKKYVNMTPSQYKSVLRCTAAKQVPRIF